MCVRESERVSECVREREKQGEAYWQDRHTMKRRNPKAFSNNNSPAAPTPLPQPVLLGPGEKGPPLALRNSKLLSKPNPRPT